MARVAVQDELQATDVLLDRFPVQVPIDVPADAEMVDHVVVDASQIGGIATPDELVEGDRFF